jgi:hypothetical protein
MWALDFNVDPMSSVIVQLQGRKIAVLDEIVIRHGTTFQACEEFLRRYQGHRGGVEVYGDASGYAQQTTGTSDYEMIRDYFKVHSGLTVAHLAPRANPAVRERVNTVNGRLRSAAGEIGLLVDGKCKELIADFEQVSYKTESCAIDKDRDRMRTHMSDALGYLVWHHCKPAPVIGEQQRRLVRDRLWKISIENIPNTSRARRCGSSTRTSTQAANACARTPRITWCGGTRSRARFTRNG